MTIILSKIKPTPCNNGLRLHFKHCVMYNFSKSTVTLRGEKFNLKSVYVLLVAWKTMIYIFVHLFGKNKNIKKLLERNDHSNIHELEKLKKKKTSTIIESFVHTFYC